MPPRHLIALRVMCVAIFAVQATAADPGDQVCRTLSSEAACVAEEGCAVIRGGTPRNFCEQKPQRWKVYLGCDKASRSCLDAITWTEQPQTSQSSQSSKQLFAVPNSCLPPGWPQVDINKLMLKGERGNKDDICEAFDTKPPQAENESSNPQQEQPHQTAPVDSSGASPTDLTPSVNAPSQPPPSSLPTPSLPPPSSSPPPLSDSTPTTSDSPADASGGPSATQGRILAGVAIVLGLLTQ
mmetsp:Transcript_5214/g.6027  ORF Transcript_5214/g.6027 Transcript_5214/m.6027 type:complete len:240 (-) Transcript_5214:255-974(-)